MNQLIALVEDDEDVRFLVAEYLKNSGYYVSAFSNAQAFKASLNKDLPELCILDLNLPDEDGLEICRWLRRDERFDASFVIMVTSRIDEMDKVIGLEIGADDYITKPFSIRELGSRVKAVLRRKNRSTVRKIVRITMDLIIDKQQHKVFLAGDEIPFTTKEYKIFAFLTEKPGWVFTRNQVLDNVWGNEHFPNDRLIDVHINAIRSKLGPASQYLINVRGLGYKFDPNPGEKVNKNHKKTIIKKN